MSAMSSIANFHRVWNDIAAGINFLILISNVMVYAPVNDIDFPVVQDLSSLLWVVNLGCIDLNPWYALCDDVVRPDFLNFDLDPVEGTAFERVLETALLVRDALAALKLPAYAK